MLEIQKILRENEFAWGYAELNKIGIYGSSHPKYPNLWQFSYDQIESSKFRTHPAVMESRGIILDAAKDWKVVAYPFSRFFNYGEDCAAQIDWSTARVQEKVDGSLMILYYYDAQWHVATRGSINAAGNVGEWNFPFEELFWWTFTRQFPIGTINNLHPDYTYMFELVSKYNRVVCDHGANDGELILIGIRDIFCDNKELSISQSPLNPLNPVKEYPLGSFDEVMKAAETLNPMQQEGYVVVDGNFNRVKIKSPKYVAIHHMQDGFGPRRIIDLIKLGEVSEVLSYYPGYMDMFQEIEGLINEWCNSTYWHFTHAVEQIPPNPSRKDVALLFQKEMKNPAPLFAMYDGKVQSVREFLFRLPSDKVEEMIGFKINNSHAKQTTGEIL